jgi:uncharacterized NAD(P)/FAD-binding protein YdhS
MPTSGPRIASVGAGFSGSLLAAQLRRRFLPQGHIYLMERSESRPRRQIAWIGPLLARGPVRPDPPGLGLDVTLDSAVVDRRGVASPRLYALGPVTRGVFWEITSVPHIREQCSKLVSRLGMRLSARRAAAG